MDGDLNFLEVGSEFPLERAENKEPEKGYSVKPGQKVAYDLAKLFPELPVVPAEADITRYL